MPLPPSDPGAVRIKNVSGAPYTILEMGGTVLSPGEEIDMLDVSIPGHFDTYEAAHLLVAQRESEILWQDIVGGLILVTLDRPSRF